MGAYDRVQYQGVTLDEVTKAAFLVAQGAGPDDDDWTIIKGSYVPDDCDTGSSCTHFGGGAIDCSPFNWQVRVPQLRRCGFAAWHRPALPGVWEEHIHAELIGNAKASPQAKAQWNDYINYLDGLVGHAPDNTWHPFPQGGPPLVFRYGLYTAEQTRVKNLKSALHTTGTSLEKAVMNAQSDDQADSLRQMNRQVGNMAAAFRYHPSLYVTERKR